MSLLKEEVKCVLVVLLLGFGFMALTSFDDLIFCRKLRIKRSIKVPAISNKISDIPPDEYSWRKYGQKPIKGSPHPRYERISTSCLKNVYYYSLKTTLVN
jgi:hypothetical protein